MREGSGSGSGAVPLTNGSGSRRPKTHTDPDPQHWLKHSCCMIWILSSCHYSNQFFNCKIIIAEDTHNYGRLVLPDFIPHSGGFSMDNPEYILQVSGEPPSSLVRHSAFCNVFFYPSGAISSCLDPTFFTLGSKVKTIILGWKKSAISVYEKDYLSTFDIQQYLEAVLTQK